LDLGTMPAAAAQESLSAALARWTPSAGANRIWRVRELPFRVRHQKAEHPRLDSPAGPPVLAPGQASARRPPFRRVPCGSR